MKYISLKPHVCLQLDKVPKMNKLVFSFASNKHLYLKCESTCKQATILLRRHVSTVAQTVDRLRVW